MGASQQPFEVPVLTGAPLTLLAVVMRSSYARHTHGAVPRWGVVTHAVPLSAMTRVATVAVCALGAAWIARAALRPSRDTTRAWAPLACVASLWTGFAVVAAWSLPHTEGWSRALLLASVAYVARLGAVCLRYRGFDALWAPWTMALALASLAVNGDPRASLVPLAVGALCERYITSELRSARTWS
ncbi:MAG: hypothetical protein R3A52_04680 [Polyangiales bacterium]